MRNFRKLLGNPKSIINKLISRFNVRLASLVAYTLSHSTLIAIVPSLFDPPEGQDPYDYVFDLTGEVRQDRTEMVRSLRWITCLFR